MVAAGRRQRRRHLLGMGGGCVQPGPDDRLPSLWVVVEPPAATRAAGVLHLDQSVSKCLLRVRLPAHPKKQVPHARGQGFCGLRSG